MNDGIGLDTLVSFCVDGDSCFFGSFWYAKLRMNGIVVLLSSGIDLPSLKSIHLGGSCLFCSIQDEIASVIFVG